MNENLKLPTPLIYVRQGCRSTIVDITGVDAARVRHRLKLCKHYGVYYVKTRRASTPRGSDAGLDYGNTMVRTTERHDKR